MLSVIPMVPGYMTIRGVRGVFEMTNLGGEISLSGLSETTHFVFTSTLIFLAIILGPVFTLLLADRKSARIGTYNFNDCHCIQKGIDSL